MDSKFSFLYFLLKIVYNFKGSSKLSYKTAPHRSSEGTIIGIFLSTESIQVLNKENTESTVF